MKQEILDYLKTQRVGVLAVEMLDGSPHGAAVHFAYTEDPLVFFFETNRDYRKTEALTGRNTSRATFVVGISEQEMKSLQLDGIVRLLKPEEKEDFDRVYFEKFPEKKEKFKDDNMILFVFVPTWWRFTDWNTPQGKVVTTSD